MDAQETRNRATAPKKTGAPRLKHDSLEFREAPGQALADWWPPSIAWARTNWLLTAALTAGLAARLTFWVATDRRLDDALITLKFDKNLAAGVGLVHNLGDGHVHGFTSALSVLVPLPGELVAAGGGLFLLRLVSLTAFVLAAVYAYRICQELELGPWPSGFVLVYLALDQIQVFFGMSGMETQIAVAVLLAGIYYVLVEDYTKSGVALGLAPLARPDFVLWVAPAYVFLFLRNRSRALRAGLVSAALLAPWLIFTTLYYGSPIPNTIAAKSAVFGPDLPAASHPGDWINFLVDRLGDHQHDWQTVAPFLEKAFVLQTPLSHSLLKAIALTVVGLAVLGAITTWNRRSWRPAIAVVVLFALYKLIFLTLGYFEWYGVPPLAVLILLAAAGLDRVTRLLAAALSRIVTVTPSQLAALPVVCLALAYAIQLPFSIPLEARVQHDIEDKVRVPLGEYLGQVVKPGQTITSESSGYVGYYTNGTLYDFPGLVSTTAVDAERRVDANWWDPGPLGPATPELLARVLHPDWLVLRSPEVARMVQRYPDILRQYRPVRRFQVSAAQSSLSLGGLSLANPDRAFIVFRRKPEPVIQAESRVVKASGSADAKGAKRERARGPLSAS
jgi:hypothetical protein